MDNNYFDPAWRLSNIYTIVNKQSKQVIFKPNAIQAALNQDKSKKRMILKSRQVGISSVELLKQLDYVAFNPNSTACILAHEQDAIKKLFRIVRRAYDNMPGSCKPALDRGGGSKYELYFPNINSRIYADLESRGDSISWLHVSEAAFFREPDKILSTLQAVPVNGRVTFETTPNGIGNHFFDWWNDLDFQYKKIFFPWFFMPEYKLDANGLILDQAERKLTRDVKEKYGIQLSKEQLQFRRNKISELKSMYLQEYPEDDSSCFLASGDAAIIGEKVKEQIEDASPCIEEYGEVKIYEQPKIDGKYVCGVDTAEGVKGDYSVATIIDTTTRNQCAVLRGRIKPYDFAHQINELCQKFTKRNQIPLLAVERNNHGHAVILELSKHIRYPNLFRHADDKIGWLTDRVSRPLMLNAFIDGVENKGIKLNDPNTLNECLTLIVNNGKIEAAQGKHDDCVIAGSIALQMCLTFDKLSIYENLSSKIRV
jgi:hypothetical protein